MLLYAFCILDQVKSINLSLLIDDLSWLDQGFSVEEFLTPELYAQMQSGLKDMVKQLVLKFGGSVDDKFSLENENFCRILNFQTQIFMSSIFGAPVSVPAGKLEANDQNIS